MTASAGLGAWQARALGVGIGLLLFASLVLTEPAMAIGWDEGYTLGRVARLRAWFDALRDPSEFSKNWTPGLELLVQDPTPPPKTALIQARSALFEKPVLRWFWPFAREEPHGHPPFYALVALAGDWLEPWASPLARARIGTMLAFAIAGGMIATFLTRRSGLLAGLAGAISWGFQPRLFAEAHYAAYDGLLTSLWTGCLIVFVLATEVGLTNVDSSRRTSSVRWGWSILLGLLLGASASTKLTGWTFPLLFVTWTLVFRSRRGLVTLAIALPITLLFVYVAIPPWWADPLDGVTRFLKSNQTRAETIPIQVMYLGKIFNSPRESLPWSNTLVWTLFVTPPGLLVLACVGVLGTLRRPFEKPAAALFCGGWAMMLLLRFAAHPRPRRRSPVLACVRRLGVGCGFRRQESRELAAKALGMGLGYGRLRGSNGQHNCLCASTVELLLAARWRAQRRCQTWHGANLLLGLALQPSSRLDQQQHPSGAKVRFASYPTSWFYLRKAGKLKPDFLPTDPGRFAYYILQNRPGAFRSLDRYLLAHAKPLYVFKKWGVPLLWVFPYSEVEAWQNSQASPSTDRDR